jgi:thiol-disulfide isomerase/thioredoxin
MSILKIKKSNLIFLIILALLIIPQTREAIQVLLHKGLAQISPSSISESKQDTIDNYNWSLKDINGTLFNFEETKGKVVLINFWATWCPPCIAEMPNMQSLYNDYNSKIEFIFVSNESGKGISEFLNKNEYTLPVYHPLTSYPKAFNITSIPRTFLIDKKGNIVIDKNGAANWNSESVRNKIDSLLIR